MSGRLLRPDLVLDARARLGESPLWDERIDQLVWVDILAGEINRYEPVAGSISTVSVGRHVGAVALRAAGGYVVAVREGFAFLDDGVLTAGPDPLAGRPDIRMNDGACDARGRFFAGTMDYSLAPGAAELIRLDSDGTHRVVLDGLTLSNGLGWSPDGTTFYHIDSLTGGVDVHEFAIDEGQLGPRRRFVDIDESLGLPDGLAVDSTGCVWVAVWGGSQIRRYTPTGRLDGTVMLPVSHVTSCAFGGTGGTTLYITTACEGLDDRSIEEQPHAGGLYAVDAGVDGVAIGMFAG